MLIWTKKQMSHYLWNLKILLIIIFFCYRLSYEKHQTSLPPHLLSHETVLWLWFNSYLGLNLASFLFLLFCIISVIPICWTQCKVPCLCPSPCSTDSSVLSGDLCCASLLSLCPQTTSNKNWFPFYHQPPLKIFLHLRKLCKLCMCFDGLVTFCWSERKVIRYRGVGLVCGGFV